MLRGSFAHDCGSGWSSSLHRRVVPRRRLNGRNREASMPSPTTARLTLQKTGRVSTARYSLSSHFASGQAKHSSGCMALWHTSWLIIRLATASRNSIAPAVAVPALRQIGPHTLALAVEQAKAPRTEEGAFLDQLITWRELSTNFVHFNPLYDSIASAPGGGQRTLSAHARDRRPIRAGNRSKPRPTTSCGTQRSVRCSTPAGCTSTCACIGRRRSGGGVSQRQIFSRRPRSRWLRGNRVGDCRQIRSPVVRTTDLRNDSVHVRGRSAQRSSTQTITSRR